MIFLFVLIFFLYNLEKTQIQCPSTTWASAGASWKFLWTCWEIRHWIFLHLLHCHLVRRELEGRSRLFWHIFCNGEDPKILFFRIEKAHSTVPAHKRPLSIEKESMHTRFPLNTCSCGSHFPPYFSKVWSLIIVPKILKSTTNAIIVHIHRYTAVSEFCLNVWI